MEATEGREARPWLKSVVEGELDSRLRGNDTGRGGNDKRMRALDLGTGSGADAKFLAEKGFKVDAVDSNEKSIRMTAERCAGLEVKTYLADIADFVIEEGAYSLIFCWNTLPFLEKEKAEKVLERMRQGLKAEGYLILGVFGPKDDWAKKTESKMTFWTAEDLKKKLAGLEILKITETEEDKPGAVGGQPKHWHLVRVVARKV